MSNNALIDIEPLGFPWKTKDPFLFCAHHADKYPKGNDLLGPAVSLAGRSLGSDFSGKDGWSMYHGQTIPGFPAHPHRGFETVTIVRSGLVDHSDSLGAAGRFGNGDVQWMTAGRGVQHSEMFPLLNKTEENPFELFQIWLNLPKAGKLANPYFSMPWSEKLPVLKIGEGEKNTEVTIIAGDLGNLSALTPPPDSWAADHGNEVAIWNIKMSPGAKWKMPEASAHAGRMLYFFKGHSLAVEGQEIENYKSIELHANQPALIENGPEESHFLLLQG
ncbi:MAG: pirin family protein, partial [Cyclobacteriaceae bacterium]|nr:pirin family protein [Cyclobacteriaceae bacterium]